MLQEFDRLEEAEASYRQAIALKSDFSEAHNNLGTTLQELGRLEEAEASCRQAIALKSDYAEAHSNLGIILYSNGDIDSALESMEKASSIDPKSKLARLLLSVLKSRKSRKESEVSVDNISNLRGVMGLTSNPLILNRVVEAELIPTLYEMNSRELDKTRSDDARYGNGRCSPDFFMFEDDRAIIKTVAEDLMSIMMEAVKSEIYIDDSFFNIFGAGGGTTPHIHLSSLDKNKGLSLGNQKYSLVYYLSEGDQNCSKPGILKLYDPSEDILPCEGLIVIIPSSRKHSAVYSGKKDRVMIGVNFYSL
jgi:tetratricopeptide (TPR) repeat protein